MIGHILLTPSSLAGALVVSEADGVLTIDREKDGAPRTVCAEDVRTHAATPAEVAQFRRALGVSPRPDDVDRAVWVVFGERG